MQCQGRNCPPQLSGPDGTCVQASGRQPVDPEQAALIEHEEEKQHQAIDDDAVDAIRALMGTEADWKTSVAKTDAAISAYNGL